MKRIFAAVILVSLLILTVTALHKLGTTRDAKLSSDQAITLK